MAWPPGGVAEIAGRAGGAFRRTDAPHRRFRGNSAWGTKHDFPHYGCLEASCSFAQSPLIGSAYVAFYTRCRVRRLHVAPASTGPAGCPLRVRLRTVHLQ